MQDQLDYYDGSILKLQRSSDHRHIYIWIVGGIGTALAAFGYEIWIAASVAVAAGFTTMLEYEQTDATRQQYSRTRAKLVKVKLAWAGVPVDQRAARFPQLVAETEAIFEAEHTDWTTMTNEALKERPVEAAVEKTGDTQSLEGGPA